MQGAADAFERLKFLIGEDLAAHGFMLSEERFDPGAFGSRFAVFQSPVEEIRLTWDGKDDSFVLERRRATDVSASYGWQGLAIERLDDRLQTSEQDTVLADRIRSAVVDHLDKRPETGTTNR